VLDSQSREIRKIGRGEKKPPNKINSQFFPIGLVQGILTEGLAIQAGRFRFPRPLTEADIEVGAGLFQQDKTGAK